MSNRIIPRLNARPWLALVRRYSRAQEERSRLEREARTLKTVADGLRSQISTAMEGSPVAYCGTLKITETNTSGALATITTVNGVQHELSTVESVKLKDGTVIKGADILSVYGGRSGFATLTVSPIQE